LFTRHIKNVLKISSNEVLLHSFYQILQSVDVIYIKNITHRDIKPDNGITDQYGRQKIIDFVISNVQIFK
jgi:serine/threonine protein kinase